jgi:hypothetical protein
MLLLTAKSPLAREYLQEKAPNDAQISRGGVVEMVRYFGQLKKSFFVL